MMIPTYTTIEPCIITSVDTKRCMVTVKGRRNIGMVDLPWSDYSNSGNISPTDSSWGGRIPEKGSIALVLAEWTTDERASLVRAYIMGYAPSAAPDFAKHGYNNFRNDHNETLLEGDHAVTTSSGSFYKLSSTGNVIEECTPSNYRRRSPEDNWAHDISANSFRNISGHYEKITHDERHDNTTVLTRATFTQLPTADFTPASDLAASVSSSKGTSVIEQIGQNLSSEFLVSSDQIQSSVVYKLCILKDGAPVYSKSVDAAGNVYEATVASHTTWVGNVFWQIATYAKWTFGAAWGAVSGIGTGIIDVVANKIDFRKW